MALAAAVDAVVRHANLGFLSGPSANIATDHPGIAGMVLSVYERPADVAFLSLDVAHGYAFLGRGAGKSRADGWWLCLSFEG